MSGFFASSMLLASGALLVGSCGGTTITENPRNPIPVLLSATPATVVAGPSGATMALTGSAFLPTSRARWNDGDRVTRFVDESKLDVDLLPTDLGGNSAGRLTVVNAPPGGGTSGVINVVVNAPVPTLTALSVSRASVGDPSFDLTLTGTGFTPASSVQFAGMLLRPTFVSYTQLKVAVTSSSLTSSGIVAVSVYNDGPGGGASGGMNFTIDYAIPALTLLSPDSAMTFVKSSIAIVGTGFSNVTMVRVNGFDRPTLYTSATRVTVAVPASDMAAAGTATITAFNPVPGGGTSGALTLRIRESTPRIVSLAPGGMTVGQPGFSLMVSGTSFNAGSVVQWNGQARPTHFTSATSLTATIGAADVASAATAQVTVGNLTTGSSNPSPFPVFAANPTLGPPIVVALNHTRLVYDAARTVFYASVPSSDPTRGNSVTKIGTNGTIIGSVFVGSQPNRMAISDDGQFLYVVMGGSPSVVRVALASFTKDIEFQLGSSGSMYGDNIVVLPGLAHSVAVTRHVGCCTMGGGVAVYDDGVMRANTTQRPNYTGSNRLARSATAERLFGYNDETAELGFRRFLVSAAGVQEEIVQAGLIDGYNVDLESEGNLVFGTSGAIVDGEAMMRIGTLPSNGPVRPDIAHGRVHYLDPGGLKTYAYSDFSLIGTFSDASLAVHTTLVRWGTNGLALGGGTTIVILSGSLVGP